jgi:hypothetical protein
MAGKWPGFICSGRPSGEYEKDIDIDTQGTKRISVCREESEQSGDERKWNSEGIWKSHITRIWEAF